MTSPPSESFGEQDLPPLGTLKDQLDALDDVSRRRQVHRIIAALGARSTQLQQEYRTVIVGAGHFRPSDWIESLSEAKKQHRTARRTAPTDAAERRYTVRDGQVFVTDQDGVSVPLARFVPEIVSEIIRDDGAERTGLVRIRVTLPNGRHGEAEVTAEEAVRARKWSTLAVGADAVIMPMSRAEEHVWTAAQTLTAGTWERTVRYAHTGWRSLDGHRRFLTNSGAIGADGLDAGVDVDLGSDALNRFRLPDPLAADGAEMCSAVKESLALLHLAPHRIMVPILAAVYRAPLPVLPETTVWVHGPSGSLKTAVAALAQQHFGSRMDAHALPAEWKSTANALEGTANALAGVLMVIDDYAPQAVQNPAMLNATVDRVVRGSANTSGRMRMNQDTTIRAPKPPQAQILGTGEDLPPGQSLRARTTPVQVEPGDVDKKALSEAQQHAAQGAYALATAGYVRWLAARQDDEPDYADSLRRQMVELRNELGAEGHLRLPEATAGLLTGWREFLRYAVSVEALTSAEARTLFGECKTALGSLAAGQRDNTEVFEPSRLYLDGIESALTSGRAHLADRTTGELPVGASRMKLRLRSVGWEERMSGDAVTYAARGDLIGWIDPETADVYLHPLAAYVTAKAHASRSGTPLSTSKETIHKELARRGVLASTGLDIDGKIVRQLRMAGRKQRVLHVHRTELFGEEDS